MEPMSGNEDEIDEFIKKHLEDDEDPEELDEEIRHEKMSPKEKHQIKQDDDAILAESKGAKKEFPTADMLEESLSSSSCSNDFDAELLSPKQSLINGMIRLADINKMKYSLTERETFIFDMESIMKVLTYREVCEHVFPCLEIYIAEQEYLKIEFFKQMPNIFKKLIKSPAAKSEQEALDVLTIQIFPLISQMLMTSEDSVQ